MNNTLEIEGNNHTGVIRSLFENSQQTYLDNQTQRYLQSSYLCDQLCYHNSSCINGNCVCNDLYYGDNCGSFPEYLEWDKWKEITIPADSWKYYNMDYTSLELEAKLKENKISCYITSFNIYNPELPSERHTTSIIRIEPKNSTQYANIEGSFDKDTVIIVGFHCDTTSEDCDFEFKFNNLAEEEERIYLVWIIIGIVVTVFFIALTFLALKCYFRYKDRNNILHPEIQLNVTIHRENDLSETFPTVKYETLNICGKETCAVCLDDFSPKSIVRKLSCNHIFHQKCIDTWIRHHSICCLCKQNVLPEATESSPYPLINTTFNSSMQLNPRSIRRRAFTEDSIIAGEMSRVRSGSVDITVMSQIRRDHHQLFYEREDSIGI